MLPDIPAPEVMDESDQATAREERDRDAALARRRPEAPPACGVCLYCGEPVTADRRWCDAGCRDDFEAACRGASVD